LHPIWVGIGVPVPVSWYSLRSPFMTRPADSNRRHKW